MFKIKIKKPNLSIKFLQMTKADVMSYLIRSRTIGGPFYGIYRPV